VHDGEDGDEEERLWSIGFRRTKGDADLGGVTDEVARELFRVHAGAMHSVINYYRFRDATFSGFSLEDAIALAQYTVLRAHVTYDPSRGASFGTWMFRLLHQAFMVAWRTVRGLTKNEQIHLLTLRDRDQDQGLTEEERSERDRLLSRARDVRLDLPLRGGAPVVLDTLHSADVSPEHATIEAANLSWLRKKLSNGVLSEVEREVMQRRLAEETLQMIGDDFGVSRERIRQIEVDATRKLREAAVKDGLLPRSALRGG